MCSRTTQLESVLTAGRNGHVLCSAIYRPTREHIVLFHDMWHSMSLHCSDGCKVVIPFGMHTIYYSLEVFICVDFVLSVAVVRTNICSVDRARTAE